MHPCSLSMTCPKCRSWMASDKDFPSSRCAQRPRRPPTQMMPTPRDHTINVITTLKCCTDAFFFCCINTTWSLQHVLYSSFCPPFFFLRVASSSGQLVYFMLYIACIFFFVMRAVQPPLYPPLPPPPPRLLSTFMRYTFTFLYSPKPLGYLSLTRLPFGYPGTTDTYDACTHSQPQTFFYPCFIIHISRLVTVAVFHRSVLKMIKHD